MLIGELGVTPPTQGALEAAGIEETDQLRRPANELLSMSPITGAVLYETVCRLNELQIGLPSSASATRITTTASDGDLEMLRLRVVEGESLRGIAAAFEVSPERVRQLLHRHFGMSGEPPAAIERRRTRFAMRPELERIIALRLCQHEQEMTIAQLLDGLAPGSADAEAQTAVERMKGKGFLTVDGERVAPTAALRRMARSRTASRPPGARRGTDPERTGR
jgi:hypothetical protein